MDAAIVLLVLDLPINIVSTAIGSYINNYLLYNTEVEVLPYTLDLKYKRPFEVILFLLAVLGVLLATFFFFSFFLSGR